MDDGPAGVGEASPTNTVLYFRKQSDITYVIINSFNSLYFNLSKCFLSIII